MGIEKGDSEFLNTRELKRKSEKKEEIDPRIDSVYESAIDQQGVLKGNNFSREEIRGLIAEALREIDLFEKIGERDKRDLHLPDKIAKKIGLIWDLSGPGTYDEPFKDDRYKDYPWAKWMDRNRLNYTARLTRKIAEAVSGQNHRGSLGTIEERKEATKRMISEHGPYIVYNGTHIENSVVADVLDREGVIIPKERVGIIDEEIKNTIDQTKTFKLPEDFDIENKEIAVVSHAPQLARLIRMINRYKPFPEGTVIRLFPLPTPEEGRAEYARMEIQAILYYVYLSKDRDAVMEPYPYLLNPGEQSSKDKD